MQITREVLPSYDFLDAGSGGPELFFGEEFAFQRRRDETCTMQIATVNKSLILAGSVLRVFARNTLDGKKVVITSIPLDDAQLPSNNTMYFDIPVLANMQIVLDQALRTASGSPCSIRVWITE